MSIGMPLYNAERYLAGTLESILGQAFHDFELVISDNGSTDRTEEICRQYASRDNRIRYYRNEVNRGAAWNHNYVFQLARGEYFKWAAYDDLLEPKFLEQCVAALDQDPSAILAFSQFLDIDDEGRPFREKRPYACQFQRPHQRMRELIRYGYTCEEIYGLMRAETLRKTPRIGPYTGSDQNLLAELALYGRFFEVPEILFFHRWHAASSYTLLPDGRKRWLWFDPSAAGRLVFPLWRQFYEYFASIRRSPLSLNERLHCFGHLAWWFKSKRRPLWGEVYYPAHDSVMGFFKNHFPRVRRGT